MKKLLTSSLIAALSTVAQAQLMTNITISITVTVPGVSTNTTAGTLNASTPKDQNMINGAVWQYDKARAGGYTNRFDRYIAQTKILDDFKAAANDYNLIIFNVQLQKAMEVFTLYPDLLSQADKDNLNAIAAKRP